MNSYYTVPGMDTGVRSTANSADVRGNVRLRLAHVYTQFNAPHKCNRAPIQPARSGSQGPLLAPSPLVE